MSDSFYVGRATSMIDPKTESTGSHEWSVWRSQRMT
jgi:hypothetical protein